MARTKHSNNTNTTEVTAFRPETLPAFFHLTKTTILDPGKQTMATAKWNDIILAESDDYELVEGNVYFPPTSINKEFFKASKTQTKCFWKGTANYYNIEVNGEINKDAAWYYSEPKNAATKIKDYIAFWKGVEVST